MNQAATAVRQGVGNPPAGKITSLKLGRENILQPDFQLDEDRFQFVERQAMLAVLNTEQGLVGNPRPFCKICVGEITALFTQEFRQLLVQIASHDAKMAEIA